MKYRVIRPRNLTAKVHLPSSKSISNRALVLNALSGSPMGYIQNLSDCDDTTVLLGALFLLDAERREGRPGGIASTINVKAAGTAMRFLTALLCVTPGTHVITGTARMQQRPIGVLVEALRSLGAQIEYVQSEGFPPLRIAGSKLRGGDVTLPGDVSSQYISALLMIAPLLDEGLTLHLKGQVVSRPYINLTAEMMRSHGASVRWRGPRTLVVAAGHPYVPTPYLIEADWSAASYWYEIELLSPSRDEIVSLHGLFGQSLQGDSVVRELFQPLSVRTMCLDGYGQEPHITLIRRGWKARSMEEDLTKMPDLAQTMVVTCAMAGIPFRFTGLQSLRIKETDRIAALQTELRKLGVQVQVEGDATMSWAGPKEQPQGDVPYLHPAPGTAIDTYEDHRMAMAFAPAAMVLGAIDINDPGVVAKSYPRFWEDLQESGFEIEVLEP